MKCCRCGEVKNLIDFNRNKRNKDGFEYFCKKCSSEQRKLEKIKNPDLDLNRRRRYREKHRFSICAKSKISNQIHKFKTLANKNNASSKKFSSGERITPHQLWCLAKKQKLICSISGVRLTNKNISVDHIVPKSKGGKNVIENIQLVDVFVNRMKNTHDEKEFLEIVKRIYLFKCGY